MKSIRSMKTNSENLHELSACYFYIITDQHYRISFCVDRNLVNQRVKSIL